MKAVVLAGGLGTRLHPLTIDLPKPMLPVVNRPLLDYTLELLKKHGFEDVLILLYFQPEVIKQHCGSGKKFGLKIKYFEAAKDFGTAGAVKAACQNPAEPVLVISADLITDINLSRAAAFHKENQACATLVLTRTQNPLSYGIVILERDGRVKKFLEKPSWGEVFSDTINTGIYILEPEVFNYIPAEKNFDFSHDLFPLLLEAGRPVFGCVSGDFWRDIGDLDEYARLHQDLFSGRVKPDIPGLADPVRAGKPGDNSMIADQVQLLNCAIGKNCRIGRGAYLWECVVWDGVEIGAEAKLERAILGNKVKIGDRSRLEEGVVVGDETIIGREVTVKSYLKIWPRRIIEDGSTVSRTIIWREKWTKSIFGPYGITGICNTEINPQFAAALGAAYGTLLGSGARISCSRDSHKASRMIYRALLSGVLSAGVNVSDLSMVPIPLNRYEIRSLKSQGGFHVRKSPFDPGILDIKLFDAHGLDLSLTAERKIERIFAGEDFINSSTEEVGELTHPLHRVAEEYKTNLLEVLDTGSIRNSDLKVVIDYGHGSAAQIFPSILGELGIEVIALNAYIDETKTTKDKALFEHSLSQLKKIVKSVEADLGIMLDTGAEKIMFCDEFGSLLDGNQALGIMVLIALAAHKKGVIAVPVKESRIIEKLAQTYDSEVFRTKNSFRNMMEVAEKGGVAFLGEGLGGFIFPKFAPFFDGMFSVCKLLEYLAKSGCRLSNLVAEIPPVNLRQFAVSCSFEEKGKIMRGLLDVIKDADRVEVIDGLKFWYQESWILVLPGYLHPRIHLYAEADNPAAAQSLISRFEKAIKKIQNS